MHTTAKSCLLYLILFVCGFNLYAQQKPAQPVKLFFEKVYLHTDRDEYTQGDTIWYKAYLVNGQNNTPIFTSGNLYVELISKDSSKVVEQQIVRLSDGTGNAEFALGDSIGGGKYMLRAYTNWMRNFGSNFVFEKDITIINTLGVSPKPDAKTMISIPRLIAASDLDQSRRFGGPVIRFYPEGGSLVEGVNSIVAVKAEDTQGRGFAAKGAILSSAGDTSAVFSCDSLGMGLLALQPVKGQAYRAVLVNNKAQIDVPKALLKGFVLRAIHRDSVITVIISCNDETLAESTGKGFTLSGKHGGKTYFRQAIAITGAQTLVKIPDSLFPDGVAALTLIEDQKDQSKPHCERLVYIHHSHADASLIVKTDKTIYQSKGKVTASIKTNGGKASLSVACVDAGIVPVQADNIVSYLMLQSELRGKIDQPYRYFDTTNTDRAKQVDLLLMTQGWRDFVWRRLQDTAIRISYNLENGITVGGKVVSGNTDKPLIHTNITLFANNSKGQKLFSAATDSLGRFSFTGLEQYGVHNVKLSASDNKGEKKGKFVVDTLADMPVRQFPKGNVGIDIGLIRTSEAEAIKRRSAVVTQKLKANTTLKEVKIRASRTVIMGGGIPMMSFGPDQSFDITAKDAQFKTLEWWMLQNVKGALQSSNPDVTGVVFSGMDTVQTQEIPRPVDGKPNYRPGVAMISPEFFVNGREYYPFDETEAEGYRQTYFPMVITNFKKIIVKHVVGSLINGPVKAQMVQVDRYLVYITLKDDALIGYNPGVLNPEVNGYYEVKTFYSPVYETPKTNSDLRTTIYWKPYITTDANGEASFSFYNADPKTKVNIIVEGLTDKGVPVHATTSYVVK